MVCDYFQVEPPTEQQQQLQQDTVYVHLIPFRNFNDWAESAFGQIAKWKVESCTRKLIPRLRSYCQGFHELDFDRYSKNALQQMLHRNRARPGTRHHVILYDYKDTTFFHTEIRTQLDMAPLVLEDKNTAHVDSSCPREGLELFHKCFDGIL
jgi:hypothetical protein